MKLWLISQDENTGYETFDRAVVAAENEEAARNIKPCEEQGWDRSFLVRRMGFVA